MRSLRYLFKIFKAFQICNKLSKRSELSSPKTHGAIFTCASGGCGPAGSVEKKGKCKVVSLNPQTIRCGSPVYDLLYFIDCSFHIEFREKYYQAAIDHYYSELRLALQRFKLNPDEVYSRKDYNFELKEMLPYTVTLGLCLLLILATEEDTAPKEFEKHEKYPNLFVINENYKKKLNEFIQFYCKIGVIP